MKTYPTLLAVFSLALAACAAAPPTPPTPPAAATLTPPQAVVETKPSPERISLATVVKQVVPDAKTALVFGGGAELVAELARAGLSAEVVSETPAHDCLHDVSKRADVVVVDGDIAWDCRMGGMVVVSRARRKTAEIQGRNVFVDARCTSDICDVFSLSEDESHRWFLRGDLPLTLVHEHLSPLAPTRTAFGVIVGDTLDLGGTALGGTTRVRIEGAKLVGGRANRDVLVGWWPDAARASLPHEVDGIAEVHGSVRLEGTLGLGTIHFPPWKRPAGAPEIFSPLAATGTLATITSAEAGLVVDGPLLARLNAKEDSALARATSSIKKGDVTTAKVAVHEARAFLHAALAGGNDIGRARFLAVLDDHLTSSNPFELGAAFFAARSVADAPSEAAFTRALYERTCTALVPFVEGTNDDAARKASDLAWKMYVDARMSPQPVHERAFKRFGAPRS